MEFMGISWGFHIFSKGTDIFSKVFHRDLMIVGFYGAPEYYIYVNMEYNPFVFMFNGIYHWIVFNRNIGTRNHDLFKDMWNLVLVESNP